MGRGRPSLQPLRLSGLATIRIDPAKRQLQKLESLDLFKPNYCAPSNSQLAAGIQKMKFKDLRIKN